ncbi:MAG: hypothetical protein MI922_24035 [Bacteroidales bacterium]|nr:hypothetical protein [Bacteroidales bacterium]
MKRQVQLDGIRRWYGDDFIDLQNELYTALESMYEPMGNMIIKGCELVDKSDNLFNISAGIVGLYYKDGDTYNYKICRIYPMETDFSLDTPQYIVLDSRDIDRIYGDNETRAVVNEIYATITDTAPTDNKLYITLSADDTQNQRLKKAFEDYLVLANKSDVDHDHSYSDIRDNIPPSKISTNSDNRFVSDAQISNWEHPGYYTDYSYSSGNTNQTIPSGYSIVDAIVVILVGTSEVSYLKLPNGRFSGDTLSLQLSITAEANNGGFFLRNSNGVKLGHFEKTHSYQPDIRVNLLLSFVDTYKGWTIINNKTSNTYTISHTFSFNHPLINDTIQLPSFHNEIDITLGDEYGYFDLDFRLPQTGVVTGDILKLSIRIIILDYMYDDCYYRIYNPENEILYEHTFDSSISYGGDEDLYNKILIFDGEKWRELMTLS